MIRSLTSLFVLIPTLGFSCPVLQGSWVSSLNKFVAFNHQWANIEDKAWTFMRQTQGVETITFTASNTMQIVTPSIDVQMGNKTMTLPASEEIIPIEQIGCTATSIALRYKRYGKQQISQLHFEDKQTYWTYMGSAGSDGNSHIREYFVRSE